MGRYAIEQKCKSMISFLLIFIFLPYVISVFVNGVDHDTGEESPFYVRVKTEAGKTVTEVSWTDYLAGILALEVSGDCDGEAMKALAVLVRTQLYRAAEENENVILTQNYLTREDMADKWGNREWNNYYEKFVRAVEETDDSVLMYNDSYAWTPYHQSSTGMTRSAAEVLGGDEFPYVDIRECPQDKEADKEIQIFTFSGREIQNSCRAFLVAEENNEEAEKNYTISDFEIISMDSAGYVSGLKIRNTICTGDQFRDAMGLPSSAFSISESPENSERIRITTTGRGHGMGMSIWTADKMAESGKKFQEILEFFFPGTVIRNDIQETEIFQDSK